MISKWGEHQGKELYSECIAVSDLAAETNPTPKTWDVYNEVFTSIYTNANFQAKQYCDKIKAHPVFGKGNFNIIGISQGGLLARDMIQNCDLGEHKVHNYISLGSPQMGVQKFPDCHFGEE